MLTSKVNSYCPSALRGTPRQIGYCHGTKQSWQGERQRRSTIRYCYTVCCLLRHSPRPQPPSPVNLYTGHAIGPHLDLSQSYTRGQGDPVDGQQAVGVCQIISGRLSSFRTDPATQWSMANSGGLCCGWQWSCRPRHQVNTNIIS